MVGSDRDHILVLAAGRIVANRSSRGAFSWISARGLCSRLALHAGGRAFSFVEGEAGVKELLTYLGMRDPKGAPPAAWISEVGLNSLLNPAKGVEEWPRRESASEGGCRGDGAGCTL